MTTPAVTTVTPATAARRQRTCRACGKKFDYPVKGNPATRHHCEDCVIVPPDTRKIIERLNSRITQLERDLRGLKEKSAAPAPIRPPAA
jgi:hypothetical protein